MAEPPDGKVHPDGVVEVTEPSAQTTSRRSTVGVNAVPPTTVPVLAGSTVCELVPLRGVPIVTWFSHVEMSQSPLIE